MVRGLVISNCQAHLFHHALSMWLDGVAFDAVAVHETRSDTCEEWAAELADRIGREYDVVLSIPLSDRFGVLAADRIAGAIGGCALVRIANFHYTGRHPDFFYFEADGERLFGPLGDYRSRIAVMAQVSGMTVAQTVGLYGGETYERLGYFDAHDRSIAEMRRRDLMVDVPAADVLERATGAAFMSFNHPSSTVVWAYARRVARFLHGRLGLPLSAWTGGPEMMPNPLADYAVCPVYPEIADRFDFAGCYRFKPAGVAQGTLSLEQFVAAEFAALAEIRQDRLLSSPALSGWRHLLPLRPIGEPPTAYAVAA